MALRDHVLERLGVYIPMAVRSRQGCNLSVGAGGPAGIVCGANGGMILPIGIRTDEILEFEDVKTTLRPHRLPESARRHAPRDFRAIRHPGRLTG